MRDTSSQYYRAFFNAVNDALFILKPETGQIVDANRKMCEMCGSSVEDLKRMTYPDGEPGRLPYGPWGRDRWAMEASKEEPGLYEWIIRDGSGVPLLIEANLSRTVIEGGTFIVAVVRDISDRKRVEQELTDTRNYLKTVFNNIHDAVFVHDIDGKVVDVNDKMLEMYRFSREEAIGLHIVPDYTVPEEGVDHHANWRRTMAGEDLFFECRGRRPVDGYEFIVEAFLTKLSLPEGDFILATVRDITNRKIVEQELHATKEYLATVFNNIHDAVFIHDVDGNVTDVNDQMLEMYRFTREEAIGLNILNDYTVAGGRPDLPAVWKKTVAGEDGLIECRGRRPKDGYEFDVEVFMTRLSLAEGDYVLASVRDITKRKMMEKLLLKEKETFFSVMEDNPHGIVLIDLSGVRLYANPEFTRITGYSLDDVASGDDWFRRLYPDQRDRDRAVKAWKAGRLRQGKRGMESRIACKNGGHKDVEFRITNLQDGKLLVLTDVTARRHAEEDLQMEKQKFQALSESSPVGMAVIDRNDAFTFRYVNPKFKDLFGCDIKDAPSVYDWLSRVYPDPASLRRAIPKWIDTLESAGAGVDRVFVRKLTREDGLARHIKFAPVRLRTGETLMACWDITKNMEAEQRVRERNLVLGVLNDIMASATRSLDLTTILKAVRQVFVEKLRSAAGGIFIRRESRDGAGESVCWGVPAESVRDLESLALQCYREGEVMHENDITLVRYQFPRRGPEGARPFRECRWRSCLSISLPVENETQGLILFADRKKDAFNEDQVPFYKTLGQQISVALQNAHLFAQVRKSHSEMRDLSLRLVRVQEDELRHVARELHDEIGQLLTGLGLALEMAGQSGAGDTTSLSEAKSLANTLTGLVRELSRRLRPSMLDDLGLLPTLPWLFKRFSTHANLQVSFEHMHVDQRRFSHEAETAVYRFIQEALTNVARHARVNWAAVRLWSTGKTLAVQVEDRGVGFDAGSASRDGSTNGLNGMRERVLLLGGRFSLESNPGSGTRLTAEIPLDEGGALS